MPLGHEGQERQGPGAPEAAHCGRGAGPASVSLPEALTRACPWPRLCAAAFLTQTVCLDDTTVKFEIWDTAGQERYHSLAPMYYRGAQAAIVVYDITNTVRCGGTLPALLLGLQWRGLLPAGNGCPAPGEAPATPDPSPVPPGHFLAGQELGEGAAAAGQPQHRHSAGGEQGRPGQQAGRGVPGGPGPMARLPGLWVAGRPWPYAASMGPSLSLDGHMPHAPWHGITHCLSGTREGTEPCSAL